MFKIKKIIELDSKNLVSLQKTRIIDEDDIRLHKDWNWLANQYKDAMESEDSIVQCAMSIINSILYQKRIVFCLTRNQMEDLVKNDKNFSKEIGWSNSYYPKIMHWFKRNEILVQIYYEGFNSRKPAMYEMVNKEFLTFFEAIKRDQQYAEGLDFVNYKSKNKLPKGVSRTKEKEIEKNALDNNPDIKKELEEMEKELNRLSIIANNMSNDNSKTEKECALFWKEYDEYQYLIVNKYNKLLASEYYKNLDFYKNKKGMT